MNTPKAKNTNIQHTVSNITKQLLSWNAVNTTENPNCVELKNNFNIMTYLKKILVQFWQMNKWTNKIYKLPTCYLKYTTHPQIAF